MVINTNIPSAYASRTLSNSTKSLSKALAKLSSGSRIVSPEDDAAGLAQSMKFGAEIGRIGAARSNVGNAISFSQTQDGFLSKIDSALRRMSELATLSADQTKHADDVANYEKEFSELKSFITKSSTKTFNGVGLFSSANLQNVDLDGDGDTDLDPNDALVKTQYDALTSEFSDWLLDPAEIEGAGVLGGGAVTAATNDTWNSANHDMENGMKVTLLSTTSGAGSFGGTAVVADGTQSFFVKEVDDNNFQLYSDATLTTVVDVTTAFAGAVLYRHGFYDDLVGLREEIGQMATEWYQKERGTNVAKVDYVEGKTWADVHDFWQERTGNSWVGLRNHHDQDLPARTDDDLNVGNAAALSDTLIENYKRMVADIKSYVNNNGAGLEVTDASDATTFQLKGADVSTITNAISSATDTNSLNAAMTKTNAADYVTRINTLINNLAGSRAYVGANISRLNMVESQLAVYGENLSAANSRIADVDVATESANYAKQQILVQSGTAMLAQANVLSQSALKLL